MSDFAADAERIMAWADELAAFTEEPGKLTCTFLSDAHQRTALWLADTMRACGFDEVRRDDIGNVIGRYGADAGMIDPRRVVTGSHYDTVRDAGRYDGRLGILLPMALVARLSAQGRRLPVDLEVVAFAEEEGVRFGSTYLGSSAFVGRFDPALLERADASGVTVREAVQAAGGDPDVLARPATAPSPAIAHYFEVHIEQGPVLLDAGQPLGVVTAIAGAERRRLHLAGTASHAGTTPMHLRRDAACAAAEIVLAVEGLCANVPGLVGTVGQLSVPDGAVNVVPGACVLSLDVRAGADDVRDAALARIDAAIDAITAQRNIDCGRQTLLRGPAVPCDVSGQAAWQRALSAVNVPAYALPSGAGHDAVMMSSVTPVSMLFVRCGNGGISHNPREIVDVADVALALAATHAFLLEGAGLGA